MNNYFEFDQDDPESQKSIFSISDFIGYACRNVGKCNHIALFPFILLHCNLNHTQLNFLASRIRGAVAQTPFDEFHRYSNKIIRRAVFGVDKDGNERKTLKFSPNKLVSHLFS